MNAPVHISRARRALDRAHTIEEVKRIRDQAEALRQYARQAGESLVLQNQIAEIKLRAERKAGELIRRMRERGELVNGSGGKPCHAGKVLRVRDLGLEPHMPSRFVLEASLSEEDFRAFLDHCNSRGAEVTQAGLLSLARAREGARGVAPEVSPAAGAPRGGPRDRRWPLPLRLHRCSLAIPRQGL